mmetsp:Transcript_5784/g.11559  ORF Transcript_5784/g.11559 Transcript_5784/m.11559 type:complete len:288 (+) Transcript_5784:113-976(+)
MAKRILVLLASMTNIFVRAAKRAGGFHGKSVFHGTFIVLGPTGSGKSTFINSLISDDTSDMPASTCSSSASCTKSVLFHSGPQWSCSEPTGWFQRVSEDCEKLGTVQFDFFDTVGLDAQDMSGQNNTSNLFMNLTEEIVAQVPAVNGIVLVHKMERYRKGFAEELRRIFEMFELFGVKPQHVLLVITNSLIFTEQVRQNYTKSLVDALASPFVTLTNALHVNFVTLDEVQPHFREFALQTWQEQTKEVYLKLRQFRGTFNPTAWVLKQADFKRHLEKIYACKSDTGC